jgi:hypothetical protein
VKGLSLRTWLIEDSSGLMTGDGVAGSATTDGMHHFDPVTVAKRGAGVLAAWHDVQIELDRNAPASQVQTAEQVGDGLAIGQLECFTVQLNVHDGAVTS